MAKESALVALDLETTGLNPRESSIRLAQIANGDETFVIDLWRNRNPTELFEALAETTVVAHGATFEWSMVYHHFGIELNNIRDTMLMSQILNMGDMRIENNLEAIALRELNVQLDKEMQT